MLRLQVWLLDRNLSPCFELVQAAGVHSVNALCLLSTDEICSIKGSCRRAPLDAHKYFLVLSSCSICLSSFVGLCACAALLWVDRHGGLAAPEGQFD